MYAKSQIPRHSLLQTLLKDRGPTRIVGFAQKSENPRTKNETQLFGIRFSDILRKTLVNNLVSQNHVFRALPI